MAEYLIQGETLDDIADAINAKTGGSSAMTPAQMVTAIGTISSGGGSLPSVITKIDGGVFTPVNDIAGADFWINHNLGVVPKGFVIWTEDELSGTIATRYMASCVVSAANIIDQNSNNYIASGAATILYNGNASEVTSNTLFTSAAISNYMDASKIRWYNTLLYYKAGLAYKWLAWA